MILRRRLLHSCLIFEVAPIACRSRREVELFVVNDDTTFVSVVVVFGRHHLHFWTFITVIKYRQSQCLLTTIRRAEFTVAAQGGVIRALLVS